MSENGLPSSSCFIHSWPVESQNVLNWADKFPNLHTHACSGWAAVEKPATCQSLPKLAQTAVNCRL